MARRPDGAAARLLEWLADHPDARLVETAEASYGLTDTAAPQVRLGPEALRRLRAAGLLREIEPGRFAAGEAAVAWLTRRAHREMPFRRQHGPLAPTSFPAADGPVLRNAEESPVAALARRVGRGGAPWLAEHAVAAAERLRTDFERGQLQPRITANWSASINTQRRGGDGLADLTDMALAARTRFDRAMQAVGPELSGLLVDVCCFLKGLETVERERQWPARSAKLVLRIALESLARHYGLSAAATGAASRGLRHWGAGDYRPELG